MDVFGLRLLVKLSLAAVRSNLMFIYWLAAVD
jgi:hypothetical protein